MDSIVITTGLRQIQQVKSFHGRSSSGCVQERFLEQHLCFPEVIQFEIGPPQHGKGIVIEGIEIGHEVFL